MDDELDHLFAGFGETCKPVALTEEMMQQAADPLYHVSRLPSGDLLVMRATPMTDDEIEREWQKFEEELAYQEFVSDVGE